MKSNQVASTSLKLREGCTLEIDDRVGYKVARQVASSSVGRLGVRVGNLES